MIIEESIMIIDQIWDSFGYKPQWASLSEGEGEYELRIRALEDQIPLLSYSEIELKGDQIRIQSSLVHTVDGTVIRTSQSGGAIDLGLMGKWRFIINQFYEAVREFPLVIPESAVVEEDSSYIDDDSKTVVNEPGTEVILRENDKNSTEGNLIEGKDIIQEQGIEYSDRQEKDVQSADNPLSVYLAMPVGVGIALNDDAVNSSLEGGLVLAAAYMFQISSNVEVGPYVSLGYIWNRYIPSKEFYPYPLGGHGISLTLDCRAVFNQTIYGGISINIPWSLEERLQSSSDVVTGKGTGPGFGTGILGGYRLTLPGDWILLLEAGVKYVFYNGGESPLTLFFTPHIGRLF